MPVFPIVTDSGDLEAALEPAKALATGAAEQSWRDSSDSMMQDVFDC
jgi:hypothetical protein